MTSGQQAAEQAAAARSYTVLARRYRSRDFDELVGQEPIARTLRNAIAAHRTAHAYLFCGTRGVGKTSMARIFAKALNATEDLAEADAIGEAILRGDDLDVVEIDGASNRGVQEARDLIAGAGLSPARCPYKIYIIDEVHMLTREAFNALLKTMEEPPPHVKFILCTTEPHKVPATIQSRCQRFDFRAIPTSSIARQLHAILDREGVDAEEDAVLQVARLGRGSMRDALSLLDRLLAGGQGLTTTVVEEMLGLPDHALVVDLVEAMVQRDAAAALERGAELLARGATVEQALEMLAEHLRCLMIIAACGPDAALLELTADAMDRARKQAAAFDVPMLVYMIAVCDATVRNARESAISRALFDAALVRLCATDQLASIPSLLEGAPAATPAGKKKEADRPAVSPPPAPALVEVKEIGDEDLWPRVLEVAARTPGDEAKVRHLVFRALEGRTLRLGIDDAGAATARFLAGQGEWVAGLVERATGRRLKVQIEAPAPGRHEATDAPGASRLEEARRLPAVREAMDVLGATVIDVRETPPPGTRREEQERE